MSVKAKVVTLTLFASIISNTATETTSCEYLKIIFTRTEPAINYTLIFYFNLVCGGIVTHSFGNITSPNYPEKYENFLHCKWLFQVGAKQRISFQFHELFSTEIGYDRVTVYLLI